MTVYKAPLEDIRFLLEHVLQMDKIASLPGYEQASPDMVEAILSEADRFFSEVVAPTNHSADKEGLQLVDGRVVTPPSLDGVYQQMMEAGWQSLAGDPQYGGQGMPQLLSFVVDEMCQSANLSFSLCPLLTKGVITALSRYGSEEQKSQLLPKLVSGEWSGTMNLTEPQAGSDLAAVKAKAVPNGDHYLITGQKIYITWGEHDYSDNIIHLVLARTPDAPEGVKGISLFIVPKVLYGDDLSLGERNDVQCIGLEHKMGIHASPTCTMAYGEKGGAVGYLVGRENEGLSYMFAMMNHARQSVGLQGVAISERAYQKAVEYARERVQGDVPGETRVPIIRHPDVRRMLMTMRALTEGARALAYSSMAHEDFAEKAASEADAGMHQRRVDLLTPLVKGWCTEIGMEVTSLGVQVHGGMGFIEETGAAQFMRDARILPIYEGTNGIQSLDLIGRKIMRDKGMAATELAVDWSETLAEVEKAGEVLQSVAVALKSSIEACGAAAKLLFKQAAENWEAAESGAYSLLMLMGSTAAGALLAKAALVAHQQNAAGEGHQAFNDAKIATACFFAENILSRNAGYLSAIAAGPKQTMAIPYNAM